MCAHRAKYGLKSKKEGKISHGQHLVVRGFFVAREDAQKIKGGDRDETISFRHHSAGFDYWKGRG